MFLSLSRLGNSSSHLKYFITLLFILSDWFYTHTHYLKTMKHHNQGLEKEGGIVL
jgi:hypothetical protein